MAEFRLKIFLNDSRFSYLSIWLPVVDGSTGKNANFSVEPEMVVREEKFHNTIAYFKFFRSQLEKTIEIKEEFQLLSLPKIQYLTSFTLKDYKKTEVGREFIEADNYIQSDNPIFSKIALKFKSESSDVSSWISNIYYYVLSILSYGNPIFGLYSSVQAFDFRIVDCGGFSTLFCAFLRSLRVPCRVVSGYIITKNGKGVMHAWSEFLVPDGKWVIADLAMEKLTGKSYFGKIYEDRVIFSKGTDFSLKPALPDGEKAAILQNYCLRLDPNGRLNDLKIDINLSGSSKKFFFI